MRFLSLDQMLPRDHRARAVWEFVNQMDLEPFYAKIVVDEHRAGRTAIAPEVLFALWLLATIDGVGSARELGRRCDSKSATGHIPYLWICGEVSVNYHSLSNFRVKHPEFLEAALVDSVTAMIHSGLVPLETIAQDGMRTRASAGRSSFRREPTLRELQQQAQTHVDQLKQENENEAEGQTGDARCQAAQDRAARERLKRVDAALAERDKLAEQREKRKKGDGVKTRCSTTDPQARNMKVANGGYEPAYNVQFATDADARVIVGVDVTNEGTDGGQLPPMLQKIEKSYKKRPKHALVDGGYNTIESVTAVEETGCKVVSPIQRTRQLEAHGKDPSARQKRDTDAYAAFRTRMATKEYKELYKKRPSVAEFPNADCRNRNLRQFNVRGLVKVKAVAIWHALAFNLIRLMNFAAVAAESNA
ncbi:transposase [Lignipirellula cremea]|uniref:Transposase DDE domain protein n=1 Tax=Lignipirellula cremea TaxID=2528010 RepID=A0A518DLR4_9BACT|nr:transposase [Lignipirellula cremea]QDU92784.1 Transposase DDE domain protein [Lignipirellula cremea]